MEVPGFITLLFVMWTLPPKLGIDQLPKANWLMGVLYVRLMTSCLSCEGLIIATQTIHYINRAIITPIFLNPSMSPIHPFIILSASLFQVINGTCIGGWLGGYGPTTSQDWNGRMIYIQLGLVVFLLGLIGNIYHDDELREIRRTAAREQRKAIQNAKDAGKQVNVEKVYQVPQAGLFQYILFPHYLCEWIEWVGFWIMGGRSCVPAQSFVLNEIAVMIPRALSGKRWYVNKFGLDKIAGKKAVLPGIL